MRLTDEHNLKSLLGKFKIRLSKKMGQHFLIDEQVLQKIINAAELTASDTVVEVGPGAGTLTLELGSRVGKVFAIEKDKRLIKPLRSVVQNLPSVEIVQQDFLQVNLKELLAGVADYKVVADIPYQITGEIFRLLFAQSFRPSLIVLLVQKEVGQRITAGPGQMSVMSAAAQLYSHPEFVATVAPESFFPPPKVESAIVRMRVRNTLAIAVDEEKFFRLLRIGFSARRKTLVNNLSAGFKLPKKETLTVLTQAGIGEKARAQELSLDQWYKLYNSFNQNRLAEE